MITLQELQWDNCFSYGADNRISFIDNKLTQIVGKNGFGKSSIPLILEEGLFNKNSKGIKKADILNRYSTAKSYNIEIAFTKDNDVYRVRTSRGTTQKISLFKNGEDISAHTATGTSKLLEEILGFSDSSLIYQSSALSMEFLTSTDTKRKQFLIELLKLTRYTEAFEIFKEVAKDINMTYATLETKINTIQTWLDKNLSKDLTKLDILVPVIPYQDYEAERAKVELELNNIVKTNKEITSNNQYKAILDSIELDVSVAKPESNKPYIERLAEHQADKRTALGIINKVSTLKGTCPTCLQKIDETIVSKLVEENTEIVNQAEAGLALVQKTIDKLEAENKRYTVAVKASEEFEKYNNLYDPTKVTELASAVDLKNKINDLTELINEYTSELQRIQKHNMLASAKNAEIDVIMSQSAEMQEELVSSTAELTKLSDRIATLDILKKAFSTSGLLTYKIECLVKDLEDITNEYLAELSSGRFVLSFKVVSDKLNVIISDNGIDVGIESLSSGEKSRVNTATLLAIRKLMQALSSSKVNLLILDETIENLDIEGKELLVDILFKETDLNTFLISHSYTHPLLEKIVVLKENKISRIE
jgi:DNA repair exonuclease SbcCD ATPase subunit